MVGPSHEPFATIPFVNDDENAPSTSDDAPRKIFLGELLVSAKVITREQLDEVLRAPREPGKKIGQLLIERGWITEAQLVQTLSLQLSVPWVSLYHIDFSRQLLNRVPRELAEQYCLIPVFVRHVKGQGETLYVAMDDPTNDVALSSVAAQASLPTRPMIASASDIRSAIRVYYGESEGVKEEAEKEARAVVAPAPASPGKPAQKPEQVPPRNRPPTPKTRAPEFGDHASKASGEPRVSITGASIIEETPAPSSVGGAEASSEASTPNADEKRRKRGARTLALTLLDGTTIQLPARPNRKEAFASREGLTAGDFVKALRAAAHGADASGVLGEKPQWEPVVAALLSILLRKGLIADWEFVEELRKM